MFYIFLLFAFFCWL